MDTFDLIESQKQARETSDPKKLFELWEDCCRRYEHNEITCYELEEMKDIIWPSLQALAVLRKAINSQSEESYISYQRKIC